MAVEMISRADASLMNLFGLQGIAETIYAFASVRSKTNTCPNSPRARSPGNGVDRAGRRQ
jgi:hypothetical protein